MLRSVKNLHNQCVTVSGKELGRVTSFLLRRDTGRIGYVTVAPFSSNGRAVEGRVYPVDEALKVCEDPRGLRLGYTASESFESGIAGPLSRGYISSGELLGLAVNTPKGMIGTVDDLVIEDDTFELKFLIVDSRRIFSEKNLLVRAGSVERIDLENGIVVLSETIDEIR